MVKRRKDQKLRLRNFDARNERLETGAVVTSRRDQVGLKEEKEFAISGKQEGSVREETNAVSGTTVMSVQNRQQKPLHPLSHQHQEVEVRREEGSTEAGVHLGKPIDSRAKTSGKLLELNYFVTIGILPNVNFVSQNRAPNSAKSARFRIGRSRKQPNQKPKNGGDKSAVAVVKDVRQVGCVSQDAEPPESSNVLRKGTKDLGPIRRV